MVCRNESKGKAAFEQLITEISHAHIDLVVVDLGTITSVYKLEQELNRKYVGKLERCGERHLRFLLLQRNTGNTPTS